MLKRTCLAIALIVTSAPAFASGPLCPRLAPLPADRDDSRMTEDEISEASLKAALEYFRKDLPEQLRGLPERGDVNAIEGFWIGYSNSLQLIEGYTFKAKAQLEQARSGGKAAGPATRRFCAWLKKQEHLD